MFERVHHISVWAELAVYDQGAMRYGRLKLKRTQDKGEGMSRWGEDFEVIVPEEPRPGHRLSKPIYAAELGSVSRGKSEKVPNSRRLQELHG